MGVLVTLNSHLNPCRKESNHKKYQEQNIASSDYQNTRILSVKIRPFKSRLSIVREIEQRIIR